MSDGTLEQFAAAHAAGATVIDVREPGEYIRGHVAGAVLMPMGQLPTRTGELDGSHPVYVNCASGNRSGAITDYLVHIGFDAHSVAGGTAVGQGRPSRRDRHPPERRLSPTPAPTTSAHTPALSTAKETP